MNKVLASVGCNGVLSVLIACGIWAGSGAFLKYSLVAINPVWAASIKVLVILLVNIVVFRPGLSNLLCTYKTGRILFLLLAIFGVLIGFALSHYAVQNIPLGVAILIQRSKPVFIIIFAAVILREKLSLSQFPWLLLSMGASVGIALPDLSIFSNTAYMSGVATMFLAAIFLGLNATLNKMAVHRDYSTEEIIAIRFGLGLMLLLPISAMLPFEQAGAILNSSHLLSLLISGFLTSFGFFFYYHALKHMPVTVIGGWELSTGVFSVILGWAVFGEQLSLYQLLFIPVLFFALLKLQVRNA